MEQDTFQAEKVTMLEELTLRCDRLEATLHRHTIDIAHMRIAHSSGMHLHHIASSKTDLKCDVLEARHVRGHVLWLRFRDIAGEVDLTPALQGSVFGPLRDVDYFTMFSLDPLFHTLRWPNGAELAPEFLHDKRKDLIRALASADADHP